jgi:hypothetical protein
LKIRKWRVAGYILFALGVLSLVIGTVMPIYKTVQQMDGRGPGVEFSSNLPYWINSYIIPPLDAGTPVNLSVLSDRAGATSVLLAAYDQNQQTIIGPALVNVAFSPSQKGIAVFTNATRPGLYILTITSYNSSYTFHLVSVWSPFYQFRSLTILGLGLTPLGVMMVYYDGLNERREKMAEEALKGIGKSRTELQKD